MWEESSNISLTNHWQTVPWNMFVIDYTLFTLDRADNQALPAFALFFFLCYLPEITK